MIKNKRGQIIWIGLIILIVIGGFFLFSGRGDTPSTSDNVPSTSSGSGNGQAMQQSEPDVTFKLTGENFKFVMNGVDNPDLIINEGDLVRIEFTSTSGFHDWVLDEFDAATPRVRDTDDNPTTIVEFIADKTGTFEYYCSVGSHRANGMKGNLIVQ